MVLDSLHAAEGNKTATTRDNSVKCTILSKDAIIMDLVIAELSDIYVKQCSIVLDCIINQGNITSILNVKQECDMGRFERKHWSAYGLSKVLKAQKENMGDFINAREHLRNIGVIGSKKSLIKEIDWEI